MHRLIPLTVALLGGCVTANSFDTALGRQACAYLEECQSSIFDAFDDEATCVEEVGSLFGGDCYREHCETFDAQAANQCISDVIDARADCGDSPLDDDGTPCADAWTDCAQLELATCLLGEGLDAILR